MAGLMMKKLEMNRCKVGATEKAIYPDCSGKPSQGEKCGIRKELYKFGPAVLSEPEFFEYLERFIASEKAKINDPKEAEKMRHAVGDYGRDMGGYFLYDSLSRSKEKAARDSGQSQTIDPSIDPFIVLYPNPCTPTKGAGYCAKSKGTLKDLITNLRGGTFPEAFLPVNSSCENPYRVVNGELLLALGDLALDERSNLPKTDLRSSIKRLREEGIGPILSLIEPTPASSNRAMHPIPAEMINLIQVPIADLTDPHLDNLKGLPEIPKPQSYKIDSDHEMLLWNLGKKDPKPDPDNKK